MLRQVVLIGSLVPVLLVSACASNDTSSNSSGGGKGGGNGTGGATPGSGGNGTGGTAGGTPWEPGGKVTSYHAKIGSIPVPVGGENTQCINYRLDNDTPLYVRRFNTTLTQGSHHMILYKSSDTVENKTPTDCQGLGGILSGEHPVFIAQQAQSKLELPTDEDGNKPVALAMEAHQMIKLELHFFNTSQSPIMVDGDIEIDTIPATADVTETDLAFWGTQKISIPAHGEGDTGVKFQRGIPSTRTFAVTTHQHHLGTEMRVWFGTSTDAAKKAPIADSHSWSDPPLVLLTPPIQFAPAPNGEILSTDGFAFDCHWVNDTAQNVSFGESVNDEMCFLWHYYYPSQGFQVCFDGLCHFTP